MGAGCDRLSILEENLVIAFTDVGGEDNNRITVILNQAYRVHYFAPFRSTLVESM
jgi:hypothetical protein